MLRLAAVVIAVIGFSFAGCKKEKDNTDTNSMQQLSKDEVAIQAASDDMLNDVNTVLSGGSKKSLETFPCNVSVDSSSIVGDTIIYAITFNGLNCAGNRMRVGTATVKRSQLTHWYQAGTSVIVHLNHLVITKVYSNKSLTLDGTKIYTNVSGHVLAELGNGTVTSIVHRVSGTIQATFDDGTTRIWNIARQRTFTGTPTSLIVTYDGYGSADGYNNLVIWGTNRNNEPFYTQLTQSVVTKESCGWDPESGVKIHQIPGAGKSCTITFGYDNNEQLVTGNNCATMYKLDWVKGAHHGTIYLPLP